MSSKRKHSPARIAIGTVAGLFAVACVVVGGFNIYIRATYAPFYDKAKAEFDIPAINAGFVPQDFAYLEASDTWIFSGYTSEYERSPFWLLAPDGSTRSLMLDDEQGLPYDGHAGGVTCNDEFIYLTCTDGYLVYDVQQVVNASDGETVKALQRVSVGFDPAFINIIDNKLYTGVFYREPEYPTVNEMHITTPDGTENHAVMYEYPTDGSTFGFAYTPSCVYSIPDQVQGVTKTPNGEFVFSTSWGFAPSHLPVYDPGEMDVAGEYMVDGNPVTLLYFDASCQVGDFEAPPMSEGILTHDGRIYILNESACNKYIFGKLYGAGVVYSVDL